MEIKVQGNTMTITCQLGSGVPSKSGKTQICATTNGFTGVAGTDYKVSLNVVKAR